MSDPRKAALDELARLSQELGFYTDGDEHCHQKGLTMPTPITSADELAVGDYVEDCRFHPARVTEIDGRHVYTGGSLIDGIGYAHSVPHCGLVKLTEEEAAAMVAEGLEGVRRRSGM